jgi:hypothetical protein
MPVLFIEPVVARKSFSQKRLRCVNEKAVDLVIHRPFAFVKTGLYRATALRIRCRLLRRALTPFFLRLPRLALSG